MNYTYLIMFDRPAREHLKYIKSCSELVLHFEACQIWCFSWTAYLYLSNHLQSLLRAFWLLVIYLTNSVLLTKRPKFWQKNPSSSSSAQYSKLEYFFLKLCNLTGAAKYINRYMLDCTLETSSDMHKKYKLHKTHSYNLSNFCKTEIQGSRGGRHLL